MGSGSHSKHKKKRSQKRSKKKIKSSKDKTKKPKRRRDSISCSDDDDSVSNLSVSSYSSEDEYRSKKRARSRDRKGRKDRKKRVKRGRSVSESSGDDSPRVKKRKKSKKSKVSESKKKRRVKKRRRSPSVSSSSGRSRSPSPCERGDGSDSEFERKERKGREKRTERSGSKRSRDRSRSASPLSFHSESHSYGSEDRVVEQYNPKRLKSVIVVVHKTDEAEIRETNLGGNKDEIVYEHDDYPSKSNDSNEGLGRREALSYSLDVSSEIPRTLDDPRTDAVKTSQSPDSQRLVVGDVGGMTVSNISSGVNHQLKRSTIGNSTEDAGSNCDDLAAALRQKALENLSKRQGKLATKDATETRGTLNVDMNSSSSLKTDQAQQTNDGLSDTKFVQRVVDDVNRTTNVPSLPKGNNASLPRRELGSSYPAEKYNSPRDFVNSRMKVGLSSRNEFLGARNTWRRQPVSHQSSQPDHSAPKQTIGKDSKPNLVSEKSFQPKVSVPEKSIEKERKLQLTSKGNDQPNCLAPKENVDLDSSKGSSSASVEAKVSTEKLESVTASEPSAAGGHNSNEKASKADGDSQLQQKTMTVMRNGELVQVSYQVYIPNKVPALARRQLRR